MTSFEKLSLLLLLLSTPVTEAQTAVSQGFLQDLLGKFNDAIKGSGNSQIYFHSDEDGGTMKQPAAAAAASTKPIKQKKRRNMTYRRALFEHTLQSHFEQFLPDDILDDDDDEEDDADDEATGPAVDKNQCVKFMVKSDYWTYEWCPKKRVRQLRYELQGSNQWFITQSISLGHPSTDLESYAESIKDQSTDNLETYELYRNGDECEIPFGEKKRKVNRKTIVVSDDCQVRDDKAWHEIRSVEEVEPCSYIFRVCSRHSPQPGSGKAKLPPVDQVTEKEQEGNAGTTENNSDTKSLIQSIREVVDAFAQQSGIDEVAMSRNDRIGNLRVAMPPFPPSRREANLELIQNMFGHAYDNYMYNAFPASELKPLSCSPGTFDLVKLPALTLIDSLDTLIVMNNFTEFARSVERLRSLDASMKTVKDPKTGEVKSLTNGGGLFASNQNVSVFETNIRVLGGLLSAHQLAVAYMDEKVMQRDVVNSDGEILIGPVENRSEEVEAKETKECDLITTIGDSKAKECTVTSTKRFTRGGQQAEQAKCENATKAAQCGHWIYDGYLLGLAQDIGTRLLHAFNTKTGIPYGTVNLLHGIPPGETTIASLAGGGTLTLEFELLSRLTGDKSFGKAAKLASRALWMRRSKLNLMGKHINIEKGDWTETLSGIGSNSDSFYEYLIKHFILFPEDDDFWPMFLATYHGVHNETRIGEWYADVDMNLGHSGTLRKVFESLMAFYPGMQILLGEVASAAKTLNSFSIVRETLGMLPERFNFGQWRIDGYPSSGAGLHPLRPELLESAYFVHRATEGITRARQSLNRNKNATASTTSSGWLWGQDYALHTLYWHTWAECGFASIKDLSPQATGGVPGNSGQRNQQPKLVNEMPSFFLTETLKYLYLSFDTENILHTDDEREWIFTTEAHPIHHEPVPNNRQGPSLRERLKDRLRHLANSKNKVPGVANAQGSIFVTPEKGRLEKWSSKTLPGHFIRDVADVERAMVDGHDEILFVATDDGEDLLDDPDLFHPSIAREPRNSRVFDLRIGRYQDGDNVAFMTPMLKGDSAELFLSRSCPNIYSSSLTWMNALNGGFADYGNVYASSVTDDVPYDMKYNVGLINPLHALALHSTGVFLGIDAKTDTCVLQPSTGQSVQSKDTTSTAGAENENQQEGPQRFDMGGKFGQFDVSLFGDGNGFIVTQVKTSQKVSVTAITEDDKPNDDISVGSYVMVYATSPPKDPQEQEESKWSLPFFNSKNKIERSTEEGFEDGRLFPDNHVVIAESSGEAFRCEIEVLKRENVNPNLFADATEEGSISREQVVGRFACAPALFGPTLMENLISTNGVVAEGMLFGPREGDEDGCGDISQGKIVHDGPVIRIVKRGSCTFRSKSRNQREREGAESVIVINRDDDGLFLMSSSVEEEEEKMGIPVSTLVTGRDGKELTQLVDENCHLFARVSVQPQNVSIDTQGQVRSNSGALKWPIVQVSSESIQVFMEGGWGVQAVDRPISAATIVQSRDGQKAPTKEWQLFLLQHTQG